MGNNFSKMLQTTETGTWTTGGQQQTYKKTTKKPRQYNSTKQHTNSARVPTKKSFNIV